MEKKGLTITLTPDELKQMELKNPMFLRQLRQIEIDRREAALQAARRRLPPPPPPPEPKPMTEEELRRFHEMVGPSFSTHPDHKKWLAEQQGQPTLEDRYRWTPRHTVKIG